MKAHLIVLFSIIFILFSSFTYAVEPNGPATNISASNEARTPELSNKPDDGLPPNRLENPSQGLIIDGVTYNYRGEAYPLSRIMEGEFAVELFCGNNCGGVDIVFCIDNTGSMMGTITGVQSNISNLIAELDAREYNYRLGGVCYGDVVAPDSESWEGPRELFDADENIATGWQMTGDFTQFNTWLMALTAWGGADGAENSLCAIIAAANNYDWRDNAIHIIVFFTDNTFYELGDGCDGVCNYTRAEGYDIIVGGGFILFSSTSSISWDDGCTAMNDPVDATFWYQNTTISSGGNWYALGVSWAEIFDDVVVLVDTFELVSVCVTNNNSFTIPELTAEIIPGDCISITSENPQTIGPVLMGRRYCYGWQINTTEGCEGPETCFDVIISGMDMADTARGCIYIPDCGCPGPSAELICPPDVSLSACPYQEVTIRINDEGAGVDSTKILLSVDGVVYSFPENMFFTDNVLRFIPTDIWPHNRVVVYNLLDVEDSMGCDLREEVYGAFITDLQAPIVTSFDPPCGFEFGDSIEFAWHLVDFPAGINVSSISLEIGGVEYLPGGGNLTYTISGLYAEGDMVFKANSFDIGIMPGQTFTACLRISDLVLPALDTCSLCGPNDTIICCEYSVSPCVGPISSVICPPAGTPVDPTISACPYQAITLDLRGDEFPLNESTIGLRVAGIEYSPANPELIWANDTLVFTPSAQWAHGQTVPYNLHRADDTRGCSIAIPTSAEFIVDLEPPRVVSINPEPGFEFTNVLNVAISIVDTPAGIDVQNIVMTVAGTEYTVGDGFLTFTGNPYNGTATIYGHPQEFDVARGDTFEICIRLADLVLPEDGGCELCGPNDTSFCYEYMFYPQTNCERIPNPFTPNGDGINDYVQFVYPEMYRLEGTISIYDIRNTKVKEIKAPPGSSSPIAARWDGTDSSGKPLPQGLYIYIIKTEKVVVCEGTVILTR